MDYDKASLRVAALSIQENLNVSEGCWHSQAD